MARSRDFATVQEASDPKRSRQSYAAFVKVSSAAENSRGAAVKKRQRSQMARKCVFVMGDSIFRRPIIVKR